MRVQPDLPRRSRRIDLVGSLCADDHCAIDNSSLIWNSLVSQLPRRDPRDFAFYVADPNSSVLQLTFRATIEKFSRPRIREMNVTRCVPRNLMDQARRFV